MSVQEKFEETKEVIRSRKSEKDGPKRWQNQWSTVYYTETKDWAMWTSLKSRGNCSTQTSWSTDEIIR